MNSKRTIMRLLIITFILFTFQQILIQQTFAEEKKVSSLHVEVPIAKQDISKQINIDEVIERNEKEIVTEKIEKQEADVEFNTQYRDNNSLAKGKIQTLQEGQDGKQNAIIKRAYKQGELISDEQISSEITRASIDKIVEVGTAAFSNNYVPIVGDKLEATSNTLAIRQGPDINSEKLVTINKGTQVILKAKQDDWYYVQYESHMGWADKNSLTYYDPNAGSDGDENNVQYSKEELTSGISFSMLLNKKSGLSLDQYKKIFENDSNDKNGIFKENAQYFYYAEQQYNVNGLFVAAVGIHESGWGTSYIATNKKNLFGYRAYDRDPYGNASTFSTYAEGIDLLARVFVKYYLNPQGTPIYNGETASRCIL